MDERDLADIGNAYLTASPAKRTLSSMTAWDDYTATLSELHDALDECFLTPAMRDRVDNALAAVIQASRRDVLDHLVIGYDNPEAGIDTFVRRGP